MNEIKTEILEAFTIPSGWNSKETSIDKNMLKERGYEKGYITATGYGRVAVPYADKALY